MVPPDNLLKALESPRRINNEFVITQTTVIAFIFLRQWTFRRELDLDDHMVYRSVGEHLVRGRIVEMSLVGFVYYNWRYACIWNQVKDIRYRFHGKL